MIDLLHYSCLQFFDKASLFHRSGGKVSRRGINMILVIMYRGITLLSVVSRVFCKVLNNRLVQHFDKGGVFYVGQAGFRIKRSCVDKLYPY